MPHLGVAGLRTVQNQERRPARRHSHHCFQLLLTMWSTTSTAHSGCAQELTDAEIDRAPVLPLASPCGIPTATAGDSALKFNRKPACLHVLRTSCEVRSGHPNMHDCQLIRLAFSPTQHVLATSLQTCLQYCREAVLFDADCRQLGTFGKVIDLPAATSTSIVLRQTPSGCRQTHALAIDSSTAVVAPTVGLRRLVAC